MVHEEGRSLPRSSLLLPGVAISRLLQIFARKELLNMGITLLVKRRQAMLSKLCANGYVKIHTNVSKGVSLTMF